MPDRDYQLGRGYAVGDSGLRVGGYASMILESLRGQPWQFGTGDLSLFLMWELAPRWHFFSELETVDTVTMGDGSAFTTRNAYFDAERLYLDYKHTDALKVRIGKFLTPIGHWNLIHADPLVWTTSRPVVTRGPFSPHATGGMLFGTFIAWDRTWEYALYGSGPSQLDFTPPAVSLDRYYEDTFGFRVTHELPGQLMLGVSYAHFRQTKEHPGAKNLFGLDFRAFRNRFEASGEFVYRLGSGTTQSNEWGLYLQGVAPIAGHFYAVARYEAYQPEGVTSVSHRWVGGLAYRPLPPLVFKAEYIVPLHDRLDASGRFQELMPEGFAASIAVLF